MGRRTGAGQSAFGAAGGARTHRAPATAHWLDSDPTRDGLPAARIHSIKDCGHVPHRECPDRFLEVLTAALELPPKEVKSQPESVDPLDGEVDP